MHSCAFSLVVNQALLVLLAYTLVQVLVETKARLHVSAYARNRYVDGSLAPFADDCERHENGGQTTTNKVPDPGADPATQKINALNCRDQMNTHNLAYITIHHQIG